MSREKTLKKLADIGITVEEGNPTPDKVLKEFYKMHKNKKFERGVMVYAPARLHVAPEVEDEVEIVGYISAPAKIGRGCFIGPEGRISRSETTSVLGEGCILLGQLIGGCTLGNGCRVAESSKLISTTLGDNCVVGGPSLSVHEAALLVNVTAGANNVLGGNLQDLKAGENNTVAAEIRDTTIGDGNALTRSSIASATIGDNVTIDDHATLAQSSIGNGATVRRSVVRQSAIGVGSSVDHESLIERSTLAPFVRSYTDGTEDQWTVEVLRARISDSMIWGGSRIYDGAVVRGHSVLGPFVYIGPGSETKATILRGATPTATIEAPHRSYLGNTLGTVLQGGEDAPLYNDPEQSAKAFRSVFTHAIQDVERHIDVPGGFHEPETITLSSGEKDAEALKLNAEGINIGALFTTSNFDPRAGGSKWPTMIGGGMKMGVASVAQTPVYLPESGILASSAKAASGHTYHKGSLILGGSGRSDTKPGFTGNMLNKLGSAVKAKLELTFTYLHNLEAQIEALATEQRAFEESGDEAAVNLRKIERQHINNQLEEILGLLRRYIDLIPVTYEQMKKQADEQTDLLETRAYKEVESLMESITEYQEMAARFRPEEPSDDEPAS